MFFPPFRNIILFNPFRFGGGGGGGVIVHQTVGTDVRIVTLVCINWTKGADAN